MVQAGEPLVELGNVRALEVLVEVLSVDAVKMRPGTPVEFTRWGGDHPLKGQVRIVEPSGFTKVSALGVEEQRVRVIADITSSEQQWQRLGDGYRVEAVFILWQGDKVLQAPASALISPRRRMVRLRGRETASRAGAQCKSDTARDWLRRSLRV